MNVLFGAETANQARTHTHDALLLMEAWRSGMELSNKTGDRPTGLTITSDELANKCHLIGPDRLNVSTPKRRAWPSFAQTFQGRKRQAVEEMLGVTRVADT